MSGKDDRFEYLYGKLVKLVVQKYFEHIIIEQIQFGVKFYVPKKEFDKKIMSFIYRKHPKAEEPHPTFLKKVVNEVDTILLKRGFCIDHEYNNDNITIYITCTEPETEYERIINQIVSE